MLHMTAFVRFVKQLSRASVAEFVDACAREDAAAMVTEQEFIDSHKGQQ